MTSFELARLIDAFTAEFSDDSFLLTRIRAFQEQYAEVVPAFVGLTANLTDPNAVVQRCRGVATGISGMVSEIKQETKASTLFTALHAAIDSADRFATALPATIPAISAPLRAFRDAYDTYIDNQEPNNAAHLLIEAHNSYSAVHAVRETLLAIRVSLSNSQEHGDDEQRLTLFFEDAVDLAQLATRIQALLAAYRDVCELTDTDHGTHPLRIVKLETGSTYIEVVGALLPTSVLSAFLIRTAQLLFRRYIREGRIAAEQINRQEIAAALDLRQALSEAGLPTESIDDKLTTLTERHVENLVELMYGASEVEVDGQSARGTAPLRLAHRVMPLIADQSTHSDDEPAATEDLEEEA